VLPKPRSAVLGSESHMRMGNTNAETKSLLLITTKCHSGSRVSEDSVASKEIKLSPAALSEPVLSPLLLRGPRNGTSQSS